MGGIILLICMMSLETCRMTIKSSLILWRASKHRLNITVPTFNFLELYSLIAKNPDLLVLDKPFSKEEIDAVIKISQLTKLQIMMISTLTSSSTAGTSLVFSCNRSQGSFKIRHYHSISQMHLSYNFVHTGKGDQDHINFQLSSQVFGGTKYILTLPENHANNLLSFNVVTWRNNAAGPIQIRVVSYEPVSVFQAHVV